MVYDYSEGAFFVAFYWFSAKYFWRTDVCVDSRVNQILRQSEMKFERERERDSRKRSLDFLCVVEVGRKQTAKQFAEERL